MDARLQAICREVAAKAAAARDNEERFQKLKRIWIKLQLEIIAARPD